MPTRTAARIRAPFPAGLVDAVVADAVVDGGWCRGRRRLDAPVVGMQGRVAVERAVRPMVVVVGAEGVELAPGTSPPALALLAEEVDDLRGMRHSETSIFDKESGDRGDELGRGKRTLMIARHADESSIGQERGQLVGISALILIADRDKRRNRDPAQRSLGRRHERFRHAQESPCVSAGL